MARTTGDFAKLLQDMISVGSASTYLALHRQLAEDKPLAALLAHCNSSSMQLQQCKSAVT
jgi:hypothetical protein